MSNSYNYNPIPPRVWSRVENPCTFIEDSSYNITYVPLTNQFVSQAQADYDEKLFYKGNILQYKGNSSRLTKNQKYSQLAKGFGPNRTKVFATQSQTYTNPNTTGLQRINFQIYPYPNQIVGAPNNPSGPFQYNVQNPFDCSSNLIQDGGTLVCGTYINPCSGEIIQSAVTNATVCNPASASDVPGSSILCWNNNIQTWFPRQRYFMNNSGTKWPQGYKGLVSAITPSPPVLTFESNLNSVTLNWTNNINNCIPISNYNIYQNGVLIQTQSYQITSITINGLTFGSTYSFYVTSVSNNIESSPSNIVQTYLPVLFTATGTYTYDITENNYTIIFTTSGTITFNYDLNINLVAVGGGGGAGGGSNKQAGNTTESAGGGGGSGGIGVLINTAITLNTLFTVTVGNAGLGGPGNNNGSSGGDSSFKDNLMTNYITATGGIHGNGSYGGCSGGAGGTATSSVVSQQFIAYNVANGGDGYQTSTSSTAKNGDSVVPSMPIILNNGNQYYFGGGGGGGVFSNTYTGGLAGNNGNGGSYGGNSAAIGQSASSYGSGGGGGGCPFAGNTASTGGAGGDGIIIIYFTIP